MKNKAGLKNTEAHILGVARKVFLQKGLEAATMADIAREAGIARTLLNYYFRTKEKLFHGIFENILGNFFPSVGVILDKKIPVFEKLEEIISLYTDIILAHPDVPIFILSESTKNPQRYFEIVAENPKNLETLARIKKEILDAMGKNEIAKMPIEDFASTYLGIVVFPFIAKNIFTAAFFAGDEKKYRSFILKRKKFALESLKLLLSPSKKGKK